MKIINSILLYLSIALIVPIIYVVIYWCTLEGKYIIPNWEVGDATEQFLIIKNGNIIGLGFSDLYSKTSVKYNGNIKSRGDGSYDVNLWVDNELHKMVVKRGIFGFHLEYADGKPCKITNFIVKILKWG